MTTPTTTTSTQAATKPQMPKTLKWLFALVILGLVAWGIKVELTKRFPHLGDKEPPPVTALANFQDSFCDPDRPWDSEIIDHSNDRISHFTVKVNDGCFKKIIKLPRPFAKYGWQDQPAHIKNPDGYWIAFRRPQDLQALGPYYWPQSAHVIYPRDMIEFQIQGKEGEEILFSSSGYHAELEMEGVKEDSAP